MMEFPAGHETMARPFSAGSMWLQSWLKREVSSCCTAVLLENWKQDEVCSCSTTYCHGILYHGSSDHLYVYYYSMVYCIPFASMYTPRTTEQKRVIVKNICIGIFMAKCMVTQGMCVVAVFLPIDVAFTSLPVWVRRLYSRASLGITCT